jgi:L,D-peptidoglycan transpeptidase YkuD (ErfK/YbiS/YcfS/YnhG family)
MKDVMLALVQSGSSLAATGGLAREAVVVVAGTMAAALAAGVAAVDDDGVVAAVDNGDSATPGVIYRCKAAFSSTPVQSKLCVTGQTGHGLLPRAAENPACCSSSTQKQHVNEESKILTL